MMKNQNANKNLVFRFSPISLYFSVSIYTQNVSRSQTQLMNTHHSTECAFHDILTISLILLLSLPKNARICYQERKDDEKKSEWITCSSDFKDTYFLVLYVYIRVSVYNIVEEDQNDERRKPPLKSKLVFLV